MSDFNQQQLCITLTHRLNTHLILPHYKCFAIMMSYLLIQLVIKSFHAQWLTGQHNHLLQISFMLVSKIQIKTWNISNPVFQVFAVLYTFARYLDSGVKVLFHSGNIKGKNDYSYLLGIKNTAHIILQLWNDGGLVLRGYWQLQRAYISCCGRDGCCE